MEREQRLSGILRTTRFSHFDEKSFIDNVQPVGRN
jgi:hypothetical protein